ncbi:MAG: Hsp20/alpha crystallin family protein [Thermoanaerobaculia bacterium]|nr:Hsp20/alpha crystallin family protein [Thermoanaerobaculia bacterium]
MAAVRRYDPFRELATLQERMNRIFDDTFTSASRREDEGLSATWTPPVDVLEKRDRIVLTAELPGFAEDQVQLRFEDGVLTLEGERRFEKEVDEARYHCVERSYGRFSRSFRLPANVDEEGISATFVNGLLVVELPKREEVRPKSIRIRAGSPPAIDVK